jgi:hypothetical protein
METQLLGMKNCLMIQHPVLTTDRFADDTPRTRSFGRRAGLRGCLGLHMLPDSFSHLHYLHHVFHHAMRVARSLPPA